MNIEQARFNMIEQQIRPWDVLDTSILALLSAVRREDFVPAAHRSLAFMDLELPLENGGTLLAPRVEARLVQDLNPTSMTQCCRLAWVPATSPLCWPTKPNASQLWTPVLIWWKPRVQNLRKAGISNADVQQGDGGTKGLLGQAPFDAILLAGSVKRASSPARSTPRSAAASWPSSVTNPSRKPR